MVEIGIGKLNLKRVNQYFVLGFLVWIGSNFLVWIGSNFMSSIVNPVEGAGLMVFRILLKGLFGYLVFIALMNNDRIKSVLEFYVAGCVLAGIFSIAYFLQTGDLNQLRQASYSGLDPNIIDIDVFRGISRTGVGNILPLWICIVLYQSEKKKLVRQILLALLPYFTVLSLMALRREVIIEAVVGLFLLIYYMPKKNRIILVLSGIILISIAAVFITISESWQDRLFNETRNAFEMGMDPRTILLLNTPMELLEQPLLGHGPGSYSWRMSKYFSLEVLANDGISAHNSFSRAAVETGIIGFIGFTVMFAALGWRAVQFRSKISETSILLRLTAIMIFLHVSVWLFFGDGISSNTTWYFIGVLLYIDRCLFWEDKSGFARALQLRFQ